MSTKLLPQINLEDVMARTAADHPELSPAELEAAETDYRRFLLLICHYPDTPMSPTGRADIVWHTHILFTQQYRMDCLALFGKFMHHRPYTAGTAQETKAVAAGNLRRLYLKHYGADPVVEAMTAGDCDHQACATVPACSSDPGPDHWSGERIVVQPLPLAVADAVSM